MHSRFRAKGVTLAVLVALTALLALPGTSLAKPKPGAPGRGFRLQARAIGAITINRVYCGLAATGEICVDSTNSSTIGGGYWPKGSPQQYVFNSGLQAAGAVDTAGGWAWAGDTTGAFFFDPKGTTQHGQLVQPIWNSASRDDYDNWPQAAYVPQGDATADLFYPSLQGQKSASEGDVWTVAWDGDPSLIAGRPHPLGIAVETRGMGWNFPTYNNDIIYFIYTFYNVTSSCATDYSAIRPGMQELMLGLGVQFQSLNNAAFGVTIPTCGYTIKNFYANFAADMDVSSDAGNNYSSVNLPFQLGYVYEDSFRETEGTYRLPADQGTNLGFTGGYGFVGVKYLASPIDPATGNEAGLRLFSNTVNGSSFNDPQNVQQLYRYISGAINPSLGDGLCNYDPATQKICFVKDNGHADMRFFQSSGPFDLAPGQFGSIVVGYVFASAIAVPGCPAAPCGVTASVLPGDPTILTDATTLATTGANLIDEITGFAGYTDSHDADGNPGADGIVQQDEITTVKGSLLGKAAVAQSVFDSRFLLPQSPATPEFFLVPGDNSVAVFWRPSATETNGDLYFNAAGSPGTVAAPNQLYDPNYRQYDVEGYRVYRGRTDDPTSLKLLVQYDYADVDAAGNDLAFRDYLGVVNPTPVCAPELGLDATSDGCPVNFGPPPAAGNLYTVSTTIDVVSPFVQVKLGNRVLLADGTSLVTKADTTVTGLESGARPALEDTGVPFVYVDKTAKNNLRYFYAVTAFDVNSVQSGPTSLESARTTKSATPVKPASNYDNEGTLSIGIFGRNNTNMTQAFPKAPGINSGTGVFSGPAQPATGASIGFIGDLVKQVVTQSGEFSLTLDSLILGSPYDGAATTYHYTVTTAVGSTHLQLDVGQSTGNGLVTSEGVLDGGPIDAGRASLYGGSGAYHLSAQYSLQFPGNYYTNTHGRGCVNGAPGFTSKCDYNGARWFDGPSPAALETFPHPTRGNGQNGFGGDAPAVTNYQNAGQVTAGNGPVKVHEARGYQTTDNVWRNVEAVGGGASTAADYNVYWGAAGAVDSVVDITHNVRLPFQPDAVHGYTWGWLTQANANDANGFDGRTDLSLTDFGCVEPYLSFGSVQSVIPCGGAGYALSATASLGPIVYFTGPMTGGQPIGVQTDTVASGPGVAMYIAGHLFLFQFPDGSTNGDLPSTGDVWSLRTYVGAIRGGGGAVGGGGNDGSYSFFAVKSPLVAVGAAVKAAYSVTNSLHATTENDLDEAHTVPDPYYVTNGFESTPASKVIAFVNLPNKAIIRIYSTSGVLVRVLEHNAAQFGGQETWDVRNRNNQIVASGVYFYHIESPSGARRVGRMTIVNFAQ